MERSSSAGQSEYFLGVDLGQRQDHTALALVERKDSLAPEVDPVTRQRKKVHQFYLRGVRRLPLGTQYPKVSGAIRHVLELETLDPDTKCTIIVDATGVGVPVVEMLREAKLGYPIVPVIISAGFESRLVGKYWHVPKFELIVGVQLAIQQKEVVIPNELPMANLVRQELGEMQARYTPEHHEQWGAWREGQHDDVVLAFALACWRARRNIRRPITHPRRLL